jgi:hypothetical protein
VTATDDDRPRPDQIELGRDPDKQRSSERLTALVRPFQRRLGRLFVPALAMVAAVAVGATAYLFSGSGADRDDAGSAGAGSPPAIETSDGSELTGGTDVDPLAGVRLGEPPDVPYYSGGALRWPDGQLLTDRREIGTLVTQGGTSLLLTTSQRIVLFDGPTLRPLGEEVTSGPVISGDGRLAAWIQTERGHNRLVLWNVPEGRSSFTTSIGRGPRCCDHPGIAVTGIDGHGRIYADAGRHFLYWSPPGRSPHRIEGVSRYLSMETVTPVGPAFVRADAAGGRLPARYGRMTTGGVFEPTGHVSGTDRAWSPLGDVVAHVTGAGSVVAHPLDGTATTLAVPPTMRVQGITWESPSTVLVVVTDNAGRASWLRCSPECGHCQLAAELGESGRFKKTWAVSTNDPLSYL